jgi:hypothetical protein
MNDRYNRLAQLSIELGSLKSYIEEERDLLRPDVLKRLEAHVQILNKEYSDLYFELYNELKN